MRVFWSYATLLFLQFSSSPEWVTRTSAYLVSEYGIWSGFISRYTVKHFITYCDYGTRHVGRNVLLNQRGVTTWHYTDTINTTAAFNEQGDRVAYRQHEWGYLMYDRFVSWSPWFSRFQREHQQIIGKYVNVGVLWAEHVRLIKEGFSPL